ncbi:ABC transport system permease protein MolT family [Cupriavidus necator N-1]|jgi:molybdate transport system permease protein|uniref:Molybdenum transport system permease n=1 Tax=Cupriavidus necator (strain ATCC 43291 / DSM 13513 / CCUG 52238 / LMG 8453 / N-1) TaxID=1042878 RepID=G0EWV8_CUPNN|nr:MULTISPECIES: molybdate ABC transporter permease subunit [Cupriavidus]AEI76029.1 ABC transport system permease protein MolT family [Cupriavidus necator N-1]KAI3611111.1 Molybdenum ABC transporter permease protein ModB [Cupriavidus necator H850]MDX6011836.1 molybdate ABC transporter permease subunit [Cupriavidus necator]QUN29060.1 molybdate ABC transporter permease subunit [Cupriavidus sp. KK10]
MDAVWVPLLLSLKVAGWATALNAVLGVGAAWALARWRSPLRDVVDAVLTLPLVLPPTVLGYYLLVLVGRRGVFGEWLARLGIELVFTWQGAVLASTIVAFPLVLKSARAAFEGVDHQLENAARVLGVPEAGIFFRVTLPLAARGIIAGVLLAFARALGEFGATLMIAGNLPGRTQTLSVAIYEAVQAGDDNTANLLVLVTSVTCVLLLVVAGRLVPAATRNPAELYERRRLRPRIR